MAQPQAAYMLPDIGAPGMAVAVEIVAQTGAVGTFGSDGLYLNEPGDRVRVHCARAADTAFLTIGPLVVSWNGRLISTHVFVHPWVQPNSWRWDELRPEFRIPIQVTVAGEGVVVDTFYIVQPTPIGVVPAAERILGEGRLGVRSRRGALLVDSLIVPAGVVLDVSTADCDPFTAGNQGYLPFVLMALGPIRGEAGAAIRVSAIGSAAGPGGGGGGGAFCDVLSGSARGSNGGDGFTSGGRGGKNGLGVSGNEYREYGQSTGTEGRSLNGVEPGTSPQYESAGGGTGHPFGLSGQGCRDGNTCSPDGGYGGGSGYQQRQAGGAGGYATRGQSSGGNTGGYEHGNSCLVPLAGGSGGASGNPQGVNVCSGSGGGGGGALLLVAPIVEGLSVLADGAPGARPGTSAAGPGGGGSGGAIHVSAPGGYSLPNLSVRGGQAPGTPTGGAGRVRLDGLELGPVSVQPAEATRYTGPTVALVPPLPRQQATLWGTGNGQDILLCGKPYGGRWHPLDTLVGYGLRWSTVLGLPEPDTLFFVVALQRILNPSTRPYALEPAWVLSPASARILTVAKLPRLSAPRARALDTVLCAGAERWDTVTIANLGDGQLEIRWAGFTRGDQGFQLVAPPMGAFPLVLRPGDSLRCVVVFRAPASVGSFQDELLLFHTDTLGAGSPWRITYSAVKDTVSFVLTDGNTPLRDYDFGVLCPREERAAVVAVVNTSSRPLRFRPPRLVGAALWSVEPATALSVPPGERAVLTVRCQAGFLGTVSGMLVVEEAECGYADTVRLSASGLLTQLEWHGSGQFGAVPLGTSAQLTVILRNRGYAAAWIPEVPSLTQPFEIVQLRPQPPLRLLPQQELEIHLRYTPTAARPDAAELVIGAQRADSACPDTARLLLSGVGIRKAVQVRPQQIDFGVVSRCSTPLDTVWLLNVGSVPVRILRPASVVGTDAAEFALFLQPAVPREVLPGDSVAYVLQLLPRGEPGVRTAQLVLTLEDDSSLTVGIRAERVAPFVAIPAALTMGTLRYGQTVQQSLVGRNLLLRPLTIQAVVSSHPDVSVTPQTAVIPASGEQSFTITLAPQRLGPLEAELAFMVSDPCPDTHRVRLQATIVGEGLSYRSALDFGALPFCREGVDTLRIDNGTADTLWLLAASLTGPDAELFAVELPPLPAGIAPGGSGRYAVFFRPLRAPDGEKYARMQLRVRLGLELLVLEILLHGRRQTPLLGAPAHVEFGTTFVGTVARQTLVLSNRGVLPLGLDSVRLQRGQDFRLSAVAELPRLLAPQESLSLGVEFAPLQPGIQTDTLRLWLSHPCADERALVLRGIAAEAFEIHVWLPDTQVAPWQRLVRLPLWVALSPADFDGGLRSAEFELEYEPSLFLLRGVSRGQLLRQEMSGRWARASFRVENVPLADSGIVTELIGDVLLGSEEESPLRLVRFFWDDGILSMRTQRTDGRLRLTGICREGGARLLRPVGQVALWASAQAGGITVGTQTVEQGLYRLALHALDGRCLWQAQWSQSAPGLHQRQWSLDGLAAGAYVLLLRTPTEIRTTLVLIGPP